MTALALTREVADELGVDGRRLRTYCRAHPDPTPATVVGWAEADPEAVDLVEEWLEQVDLSKKGGAHA